MNKKLEIKRLVIYLALSFGLAWTLSFWQYLSGYRWDGTTPRIDSFVGLGMFAPLVAHVLTRILTKEGLSLAGKDSMMLGIHLKDKKWIYYIVALLLPWVYMEIGRLLLLAMVPSLYDPEFYKSLEIDHRLVYFIPVISMISASIASVAALGEEAGWRGYMMPKLIKLMGTKKALLVGGVIWGLWHAPLTCMGHNFGTGYPGFPYVGILIMCVFCILMGIMLTYLTLKTNSVWPAAIMHAVNNANPCVTAAFINTKRFETMQNGALLTFIGLLIPVFVCGIIFLVFILKQGKQEEE